MCRRHSIRFLTRRRPTIAKPDNGLASIRDRNTAGVDGSHTDFKRSAAAHAVLRGGTAARHSARCPITARVNSLVPRLCRAPEPRPGRPRPPPRARRHRLRSARSLPDPPGGAASGALDASHDSGAAASRNDRTRFQHTRGRFESTRSDFSRSSTRVSAFRARASPHSTRPAAFSTRPAGTRRAFCIVDARAGNAAFHPKCREGGRDQVETGADHAPTRVETRVFGDGLALRRRAACHAPKPIPGARCVDDGAVSGAGTPVRSATTTPSLREPAPSNARKGRHESRRGSPL